jgi:hypothetical protein
MDKLPERFDGDDVRIIAIGGQSIRGRIDKLPQYSANKSLKSKVKIRYRNGKIKRSFSETTS